MNPQFQTGQIVSIKLTNWVTFDKTEIQCEPGLNLIVGPNGTGKSSIVCAICLGLGGKLQSLERGDRAVDYIKYGRDTAQIQIELFNANGDNYRIHRTIIKRGGIHAGQWALNGQKSKKWKIKQLVTEKLNIKVDNLCQFLAQDKVSDFARLSPTDLLIETEKAIEDNKLHKWHKFLMDKGKEAMEMMNDIQNTKRILSQNKQQMNTLKSTMQRFEELDTMKREKDSMETLREWKIVHNKMSHYKEQLRETNKLKKKYDKMGGIGVLKQHLDEWELKTEAINEKVKTTKQELRKCSQRRKNALKKEQRISDEIKELHDEEQFSHCLKNEAFSDEREEQIKRIEEQITDLKAEIANFDHAKIDKARKDKRKLKDRRREIRKQRVDAIRRVNELTLEEKNQEHDLNDINHKLSKFTDTKQQNLKRLFEHNTRHRGDRADERLHRWICQNRQQFDGQIYGPIASEMNIKNKLFAAFLNNKMSLSVLYGYVCTHKNDWIRILQKAEDLKLRISVYDMSGYQRQHHIRRPVDVHILQQYGISGYLDETYEAADIIKQCLNDNYGLHQQAYATKEVNAQSLDHVMLTRKGQSNVLTSLITPTAKIACKASRYSQHVLRSMISWKPRRNGILRTTPDHSKDIKEYKTRKIRVEGALNETKKQKSECQTEIKEVEDEDKALKEDIKKADDVIFSLNDVQNRLMKKKDDLEELTLMRDPNERRKRTMKIIQKKVIERVDALEKYWIEMVKECNLMKELNPLQLQKKHYAEEQRHIRARIDDIDQSNVSLKNAWSRSKHKAEKLLEEYKDLKIDAYENYPNDKYKEQWTAEDKALNINAMGDIIIDLQARIGVFLRSNPHIQTKVATYSILEKKVRRQESKLEKKQTKYNKIVNAIREVEAQWKPELTEAIAKISSKFGEFFRQFNNADGKIVLANHRERGSAFAFDKYRIDIYTKFRADEDFTRLTSISQSGGEKSVSTMLYLLSLQQVTTVPFRVVDEINQGMDPTNERRVMQILNYECTPNGRNNTSIPQYFVVTPKLLPRLKYSPCSSVFIIFNGPFQMPHQDWKINDFVHSQLTQSQSQLSIMSQSESPFLHNSNHNHYGHHEVTEDEKEERDQKEEECETEPMIETFENLNVEISGDESTEEMDFSQLCCTDNDESVDHTLIISTPEWSDE